MEKWLKFLSSHSVSRNRTLNFIPAFFRRFKDLEPMLPSSLSIDKTMATMFGLNLQNV